MHTLEAAATGDARFSSTQNHYLHDPIVEAQLHARVELHRDVQAAVLDPSFKGTSTAELIEAAATKYGFPIEWHPGYVMKAESVGSEFRGPEVPPVARYIQERFASHHRLDAATIGHAAVSVLTEPAEWQRFGSAAETLQFIKYVWHTLVTYGHDA